MALWGKKADEMSGTRRPSRRSSAPERIGLVGCVKSKRSVPSPAADLYVSTLFEGRRRFVERTCDRWFILSAKHGLLEPDAIVEPYDESLVGAPNADRRRWAQRVLAQIDSLGLEMDSTVFELHAGADYRNHGLVAGLVERHAKVEVVAAHLGQGQQLAFYAGTLTDERQAPDLGGPRPTADHPSSPAGPTGGSHRPPSGRYKPLTTYLTASPHPLVRLRFSELERILGASLPASARAHRPWWANSSHSQAMSWLAVGWRVDAVDLRGETVTFRRTGP